MQSRRSFLLTAGAAAAVLPGAVTAAQEQWDLTTLPPEMAPQRVQITPMMWPGEIHVVPDRYSLYLTLPFGEAIRYFVGVGRDSLYESGEFTVGAKKEWPSWTPTPDMIAREPDQYAQYADGMPGGPGNPLGARALYLFQPGRGDTFLRIHGTDKPDTIMKDVSNGCARLIDAQVVDLYDRVPLETRVVLHPKDIVAPFDEMPLAGQPMPQVSAAPSTSVTVPQVEVQPLPGAQDPLAERLDGILDRLGSGGLY